MSAETLREAAKVLRERADDAAVAHGIDWRTSEDAIYRVQTETADGVRGEVYRCYACGGLASTAEETATFIATLHPGVAMALAGWLDAEVERDKAFSGALGTDLPPFTPALRVAEAILGGAS